MPNDRKVVLLVVALALAPWLAIGPMMADRAELVRAAHAAEDTALQYDARLVAILDRLDAIARAAEARRDGGK